MNGAMKTIYRLGWMLLLILLLAGCNLLTPEQSPISSLSDVLPAVSVGPLPPALVETSPLAGGRIPVAGDITFYFNQPMDRPSVEEAIQASPAFNGSFTWKDNLSLTFTPAQPWPANTMLNVTIAASAESSEGLTFEEPITVSFQTADYLRLVQGLPEQKTMETNPQAAIVASFNQPVVPLGAESVEVPAAFSLDPAANGRGEWLNTSTYIFYPEPALTGGQQYTVQVTPGLTSTDGTPLEAVENWSFVTLPPGYESYSPQKDSLHVFLDAPVVVKFNQAMNPASVEQAFSLVNDQRQAMTGTFSWSVDLTEMTFTPSQLYQRGMRYTFFIPAGVQSRGGTPISESLERSFYATMELFVLKTNPGDGGIKDTYSPLEINFNAPIETGDPLEFISVTPEVDLSLVDYGPDQEKDTLWIYGNFEAEQNYTVTVGGGLTDIWGDDLEFDYSFSFIGAPLSTSFNPALYQGRGALFVNPDEPLMSAQVVNVDQVLIQTGAIALEDYLYLQHAADYEDAIGFRPDQLLSSIEPLVTARNRNQVVGLSLNQGQSLQPGLYWVSMDPIPMPEYSQTTVTYAVVSYVQAVFKASATDALVWAIDTRTNSPVAGAPVKIVDANGQVLAQGTTDNTGLFKTQLAPRGDLYESVYAVLYEPGNELFSMVKSDWDQGISGWDFGYSAQLISPQILTYIYTDRPIYRPGQTVNFRMVAREAFNGRYQVPSDPQVEIILRDDRGAELQTIMLPLNEFGTANASYTLAEEAQPGYYEIYTASEVYAGGVTFQVSEYRKPEIDLSVEMLSEEALAGDQINGEVSARYFFDAPAAGTEASWSVYVEDSYFSLPGYQVGPIDSIYTSPFYATYGGQGFLGRFLSGGSETTGEDGRFSVTLTSAPAERTQTYTLEILVQDESGFPVANRASTTVHPAPIYLGVKSDSWVAQANSEAGFEIFAVGWDQRPAGVQNVSATFGEVTWQRGGKDRFGFTTYNKQVQVLSQGNFQTNSDGKARLAFTPANPGIYQMEVRSGNAVTQTYIWVGGPGTAIWPNLDNNQIELITEKDSFKPGEVAAVFIPNPFNAPVLALVTYERGVIMESQIVQISGSGMSFPVQLTDDSAPNLYMTVTLLGVDPDGETGFRYGMVNLPVDPAAQRLNVEVLGQPEKTAPGEPVRLTIRVTDNKGAPVQGEFSLSLVDQAVLALARPFEQSIFDAFYGQQGLGVRTGISLVADAELFLEIPGGLGGGGGGDMAPAQVRTEFEDTAYWNASVITGADGLAEVEAYLPDNLTTWRLMARGLTIDTRVGEAISEIITTKPLLVRPVTPRFVVVGDHLELAVVVHNNTDQNLKVDLAVQVRGITLDDRSAALQTIDLPAMGRVRVGWWGTVDPGKEVEVVFAAEGGGFKDASQPAQGSIPVMAYAAPQAFATAGVMDQGGERLELVSLPRSFDPLGGSLRLEMASSLAGVAMEGLDVLEEYESESIEYTVSRFLPNLEILRAIQEFGLDQPALRDRLDANVRSSLGRLEREQNFDGGWGWYRGMLSESNPVISAYVLMGLVHAQQAGYQVSGFIFDNAVRYLSDYLVNNRPDSEHPWLYDQNALIHFALSQAGSPIVDLASDLMDQSDQMDPWAKALIGLVMAEISSDGRVDTVFSDLQTSAIRSATGAHWDIQSGYWQTLSSQVFNQAVVVYALAQKDPASPLVADGLRYLMAYRDASGGWQSSYSTSWALLAITEVIRGTAELGGEFAFSATLNENPFATGQAGGAEQFTQVVAETGLESLLPDLPNALTIQRDPGVGRLYYRAYLNIVQPVESVAALNRGVGLSRAYYPGDLDCSSQDCRPLHSAKVGDFLTVRVTLNIPNAVHYLKVEDYIPAGTEVLDLSLQTSQIGEAEQSISYDPLNPLSRGWGWWYFGSSQVYDDHIAWMAEYLPAGTYELTYTLVVLQPGQFQVIPAQAWQMYFPEVQGVGSGSIFEVVP